ncbi:hypothetical protein DPMN_010721 [Dreissena polymorpha]|uniref:Uncharacterized protein n=1 Tax=Dreissena polymorpha TaxID=45954 RepID=A0A9D4S199_DREPO|nr:hypothetical protein DPMN_010721 [Dreissena polymorpha]
MNAVVEVPSPALVDIAESKDERRRWRCLHLPWLTLLNPSVKAVVEVPSPALVDIAESKAGKGHGGGAFNCLG